MLPVRDDRDGHSDHAVTILEELDALLKGRSVVSAQLASSPSSPAIESAWIVR
jgi:hypothetical protein